MRLSFVVKFGGGGRGFASKFLAQKPMQRMPHSVSRKTIPILVKIISNLRKIISNVI